MAGNGEFRPSSRCIEMKAVRGCSWAVSLWRGIEARSTMKSSEVAEMWEANAETWTRQARAGYDVYRDALNTHAFLAMLPAISDLHGLYIGCGEGSNTRELARLGAQMHAIDIAPTFVRHAQCTEASDPF